MGFVDDIAPVVVAEYQRRTNWVLPSVIIGQFCLESNDGTSGLCTKYKNIGGYKSTNAWKQSHPGQEVLLWTTEVINGIPTRVQQWFRVYNSYEEYVKAHFDLLTTSSRYTGCVNNPDPRSAISAIRDGGYATADRDTYINGVMSKISKYNLTQYDVPHTGGGADPGDPFRSNMGTSGSTNSGSINNSGQSISSGKTISSGSSNNINNGIGNGTGNNDNNGNISTNQYTNSSNNGKRVDQKNETGSGFSTNGNNSGQNMGYIGKNNWIDKKLTELVVLVINAQIGSGDQRKQQLGDKYDAVQDLVNHRLLKRPVKNSTITALAKEVIAGEYGSGYDRKIALGDLYDKVQARVNEILKGGK